VVGLGFLLFPQAYSTMFPKEIKQAAAPYVQKADVRKMKLIQALRLYGCAYEGIRGRNRTLYQRDCMNMESKAGG